MFILTNTHSLANTFLAELRDKTVQLDPMRFRRNIERLGEIMAYEISRDLPYESKIIQTPLGKKNQVVIREQPVLCTVLRAGLPFHQGFLNYFDRASSSFLGAWREEGNEISVKLNYFASPDLHDKNLIMVDPMLATGKSLVKAIHAIHDHGTPRKIFVAAIIASPEGVEFLKKELPDVSLYLCDLDEKLDTNFYIVPGLGDAGDLAYGKKI